MVEFDFEDFFLPKWLQHHCPEDAGTDPAPWDPILNAANLQLGLILALEEPPHSQTRGFPFFVSYLFSS